MFKAAAELDNGGTLVVIGLEYANIKRMVEGDPVLFALADLDIDGGHVMLFYEGDPARDDHVQFMASTPGAECEDKRLWPHLFCIGDNSIEQLKAGGFIDLNRQDIGLQFCIFARPTREDLLREARPMITENTCVQDDVKEGFMPHERN